MDLVQALAGYTIILMGMAVFAFGVWLGLKILL